MRPESFGVGAGSRSCRGGSQSDTYPFAQIHETIESINQLKTQRDFMLSFSTDPQDFIQEWLRSQRRDLKVCPFFLRVIPC